MSDGQVIVTIKANDQTSQAFKAIASSAQAAAKDIEGIGKGASGIDKISGAADKGSASLEKVGSSAGKAATGLDKTARSAEDTERSFTRIGAAAGTVAAGLSKMGQAAQTQSRQLDGLKKSYGDAADEMIRFTEAIQDTTIFSNEDAREAAQIASTLTREYGLTTQQVQELIRVSADLASINGIGLADAVQRTSSAIRGEAESAEMLGLTLNQQAIDRENLTLSMTNQEAAQFRLNALMEQAAFAEGAAAQEAAKASGQAQQLANNFQDLATNVGAALGPLSGVVAPMGDLALTMPIVAGGIGKLVGSLQGGGAIAKFAASFGPLGVAAGVAAAAIGVLAGAVLEYADAASQAADPTDELTAAWADFVNAGGDASTANKMVDQIEQIGSVADTAKGEYEEWNRIIGEQSGQMIGGIGVTEEMMQAQLDNAAALEESRNASERLMLTDRQRADIEDDIGEIYRSNLPILDDLIEQIDEQITLYQQEKITGEELVANIDAINAGKEQQAAATKANVEATKQETSALSENAAARQDVLQAQIDENREAKELQANLKASAAQNEADHRNRLRQIDERITQEEAERQAMLASIQGTDDFAASLRRVATEGYAEAIRAGEDHEAALEAGRTAVEAYEASAAQLVGTLRDAAGLFTLEVDDSGIIQLDGSLDALNEVFGTTAQSAAEFFNTIQPGNAFLEVAADVETARAALEGVLETFAQIQALGAPSQAAADIAQNIVGDPGVYAEVDRLLDEGVISLETWNSAVEAGNSIMADNARVQNEVLALQAERMPLLAEEANAYADSVVAIRDLSAANQDLALSSMDAATQQKLLAVESALVSEALGQMPTEKAIDLVIDTANSDEEVAAILEQIGIIEQTPDGEWAMAVDISGGPEAEATITDIVTSVDELKNALIEIGVALTGDESLRELQTVKEDVEELDGKEARVTVTLEEGATLQDIQDLNEGVNDLDAASASPNITVDDIQPFADGVRDAHDAVNDLDGASASPEVNVEGAQTAEEAYANLHEGIQSLDGASANPEVTATVEGKEEVDEVKTAVEEVDGKEGRVTIHADGAAEAKQEIDGAVESANAADGKKATITVETVYADPSSGPMSSEDITGKPAAVQIPVEARVMTFDTGLIDIYEPADITVEAKVNLDSSALDNLTGSANPSGGAAKSPSITIDAKVTLDSSEVDNWSAPESLTSFDGKEFKATLAVTDSAGSKISAVYDLVQVSWAGKTYTGTLAATDSASSVIATAQGAATTFATTYTATLAVADQATPTIGTAQGQATAFAATYTATLAVVDNASGTIATVSSSLDALNGKTATTYINTVETTSSGTAMMHGGVVRPLASIPHAANGRAVMVGEAGPEVAILPYGSLVQPHGASMSRLAATGAAQTGSQMADAMVAQLIAGRAQAQAAGHELGMAAVAGMQGAASEIDFLPSIDATDAAFRLRRFKMPKFPKPPPDLPDNATERDKKQHEKAQEHYEKRYGTARDRLDSRIDMAEEQIGAAPTPQAHKQALKIYTDLLSKRNALDGAEERAERQKERAAQKEEAAARTQHRNLDKSAEKADQVADSVEGVGDEATVAAGAIQKLNATLSALGKRTSEPEVDVDTEGFDEGTQEVRKEGAALNRETYSPTVSANREQYDAIRAKVLESLREVDTSTATSDILADDSHAQAILSKYTTTSGTTIATYQVVVEGKDNTGGGGGGGGKGTTTPPPSNGGGGGGEGGGGGKKTAPPPKTGENPGQWRPPPGSKPGDSPFGTEDEAQHGTLVRPRRQSLSELIPRAANGRHILVGEAGPEIVALPFGAMVQPHGASMARLESGGLGGRPVVFNAPVTFVVQDQDVMGAIERKMRTEGRV